MKKTIYLIGLTLILSIALLGCNSTSDDTENASEDVPNEEKQEDKGEFDNTEGDLDGESVVEDGELNIILNTGSTETVTRKIEGMDEEINVINYQIDPYGISYQLDERFADPEVEHNQITYTAQSEEYEIVVEVVENSSLEEVVLNLQERFETEGYEEKGELESTPLEENDLVGNMQFFSFDPMKGFYVYEIDEHVLVITYQYPAEAGDGMGPLLEALRTSIHVQ